MAMFHLLKIRTIIDIFTNVGLEYTLVILPETSWYKLCHMQISISTKSFHCLLMSSLADEAFVFATKIVQPLYFLNL